MYEIEAQRISCVSSPRPEDPDAGMQRTTFVGDMTHKLGRAPYKLWTPIL